MNLNYPLHPDFIYLWEPESVSLEHFEQAYAERYQGYKDNPFCFVLAHPVPYEVAGKWLESPVHVQYYRVGDSCWRRLRDFAKHLFEDSHLYGPGLEGPPPPVDTVAELKRAMGE